MRVFIALEVPQDVQQRIASLIEVLAASHADVGWVRPEQLHVTMKFLGELSEEQRAATEALIRRVAAGQVPFIVGLRALGAFPSLRAPRVLWVGIDTGQDEVVRLAETLEREGSALGWPVEARPFSAHVTIGRVRSFRGREALLREAERLHWQPPAPWQVRALTLYQSLLSPSGASYRVLAEAPFSGAGGSSAARDAATRERPGRPEL